MSKADIFLGQINYVFLSSYSTVYEYIFISSGYIILLSLFQLLP